MAGPALDYVYRYPQPSQLVDSGLLLATCGAPGAEAPPPFFFRGSLTQPRVIADLLLAVSRVVGSRFHIPPAMLARILREADPVVTVSEDRLRFEGFSGCCSAYARVDLLPEALDGTMLAQGTTNVDFNAPMRAALARLRGGDAVRLTVGAGEVELERGAETVTERKVPLPVRWLKGFLEVQAHQARMLPRLEVSGAEARRFFRSLPRGGTQGRPAWVTPLGSGLRLSQVQGRGAVRVAGVERLRVLEDIAAHARTLRVYAPEAGESSVWELETPVARFHLALSPEVWRGFSGEGQALSQLAGGANAEGTERVRTALRWQSRLDEGTLGSECGLGPAEVRAALAQLAVSGVVGYDVSQAAYFHRELPYDLSLVELLQPRLKDARRLVAEQGVRVERNGPEGAEAWVRGSGVEHRVRLTPEGARCTCPWWAKHQGERGPCKHVLAVQIAAGEVDDA